MTGADMRVLTGIDVLGVQRYVFASNRLRDALAASWLVHLSTSAGEELKQWQNDVVLDAGGNALLCFSGDAQARDFAARYTRKLHDSAPGLEVVVAHESFQPGKLAEAIGHLQMKLARARLERAPSVPQLGLSVTAPCRITGLPAAGLDPQDPGRPLSRGVLRWRDSEVRSASLSRWDRFIPPDARRTCAFPDVLDQMGRTFGDTSLIGVVHVDGNGIGQQIERWRRACVEDRRPDDDVRSELREWSRKLELAGDGMLKAAVARVLAAIERGPDGPRLVGGVRGLAFDLDVDAGRTLLPLRPVLLGGDDLTFVCDGRIALDLAEAALEAFRTRIPHLGEISACAGVALVAAHTPFERAYEVAHALCRSAKRGRRGSEDPDSWIDWHVGTTRPGESIADLRGRSYRGDSQIQLTCRPYRLGTSAEPGTWRWLSRTVLGTGERGFRGERWSQHRNKVKSLAQVVRDGAAGVRRAHTTWTAAADLFWPEGLDESGFHGARTPLLDAAELLDLHLPLARESAP